MKTEYKTYRGVHGTSVRIPTSSITPAPKLHQSSQPFPFAALADKLSQAGRDTLAVMAKGGALFEEAIENPRLRYMMARETVR